MDEKELIIESTEGDPISLEFVRKGRSAKSTLVMTTVRIKEFSLSRNVAYEIETSKGCLSDLKRVHSQLKGTARIVDCDYWETSAIEFRAMPGPGGRFEVGGYCGMYPGLRDSGQKNSDWLKNAEHCIGLEFVFDGLILDQSYLAEIIKGLENILIEPA